MEDARCHICKESEIELLVQVERREDVLNVSICTDCGLVLLSPRWGREEYDRYYASQYSGLKIPPPPHLVAKAERVWDRVEASVSDLAVSNVLDVGSGTGYVIAECRRRHPESALFAIEPSPRCVEYIVDTYGAQVISRYVEGNWSTGYGNFFDIIVMRHVLEHLLDPVGTLIKLRETMASDGVLYIAVPNTMWARKFISPSGAFTIPHIYYYSTNTLVRTAEVSGLQPMEKGIQASEIWAIFRKGNPQHAYSSIYDEQKSLLLQIIELEKRGLDPSILNERTVVGKLKHLVPNPIKMAFKKSTRLLKRRCDAQ